MLEQHSSSRRPRQRALEYFYKEFLTGGTPDRRLPTIEELSVLVGVSQSTIRNAIRELCEKGHLRTVQGRGTFVARPKPVSQRPLVLASNIISSNSSLTLNWSTTIYYGAINEAAEMPEGISIHPVIAKANQHEVSETLLERMEFIDLLLLYSIRWPGFEATHRVATAYEEAGKPVVWITPPMLNTAANFVSADFLSVGWRIGKAWRMTGRRRYLYIASFSVAKSTANQLLLQGFSNGIQQHESTGGELRVAIAEELNAEAGAVVMEEILASGYRPDAILCDSDFVARGVVDALQRHGFSIPGDVSVVGGTGLHSTQEDNPELSVLLQPMEAIGAAAVRMLYQRFRSNNSGLPGVYLPTIVHKGTTTRPEENRLLEEYEGTPILF